VIRKGNNYNAVLFVVVLCKIFLHCSLLLLRLVLSAVTILLVMTSILLIYAQNSACGVLFKDILFALWFMRTKLNCEISAIDVPWRDIVKLFVSVYRLQGQNVV